MANNLRQVSIIGAGTLGGTIAYGLIMANVAKEILMVDMSNNIVQGQVLDLADASEGTDVIIRAGTFKEARQSTLVIITADVQHNETENHVHWLIRSRRLLLSIASSMSPVRDDIMILVASDPVDLYVQSLQDYFTHVPSNKIFGIGTTMATTRFNTWLNQMKNNNDVVSDAYVIGTQDDPIVIWNHAKINDEAVTTVNSLIKEKSAVKTIISKHRYNLICDKKGKAWYGMAAAITRLSFELLGCSPPLSASAKNKGKGKPDISSASTSSTIVPPNNLPRRDWVLSVRVPEYDCCLSWPVMISTEGIERLVELPLAPEESAEVLKVVKTNLSVVNNSMTSS